MGSLTLVFAVVTLMSLVNIGQTKPTEDYDYYADYNGEDSGIVGSVSKWVLYNDSPGCGDDFISTPAECLEAAKKLGFNGRLSEIRTSDKPPGCSSGIDGYIYFNEDVVGTTGIADLRSICLSRDSAVIPEAFALKIPACEEEDNVKYYGHDLGPNNTKVFPNGTVADCANWCGEVEECKFWTFEKTAKTCWLKDDKGTDRRIDHDRVSGSKECAAPKNCGEEEHHISCCPNLTSGDNAGEREEFLPANLATEPTCAESCKKHKEGSVGITESSTQFYPNGKPKCWCEFGVAKHNTNLNYQTCMFSRE